MHIDRRLLKLSGGVRFSFVLTIIFSILSAGAIIGQAAALSKVIHRVFIQKEILAAVLPLVVIFAVLSLCRALLLWGQESFAARVAGHVKRSLRLQLNRHLSQSGPVYIKTERTGEISNVLMSGVEALDAYFSKFMPQLFSSVLIPVAILLFVFPVDPLSGVVFLITAPLIPYFMRLIGSLAESLNKKQWKTLSLMSAHFLDVLQGLTTLKLLGRSKGQIRTIVRISDNYRTATMKVLKVAFLSALVLELLATLSIAIVAVEIGLRLLYGRILFEHALFLLILAPEFYLPIRVLGTRYHAGMEGVVAAQRIFEILETPLPEEQGIKQTMFDLSATNIRFEGVRYAYQNGERPALNGIDLEVRPGRITVLAGPSGSGKTSVSSLLLRFIRPDSGRILIGDRNLSEIDADAWRSQIAWVPQSPYLFHETVAENIRLANPAASHSEIVRAAKLANIHETIVSLRQGYETIVGERGSRFSGGQAQRIALARAFLKDAPFLILDEPTANLDPRIEMLVFEAMQRLMSGRTVLLIGHRLNSFRYSHSIIVLDGGRVAESGSHDDLLQKHGLYARFVDQSTSGVEV
jgi:ATP-binding cassette subfamily C protein CydD